jgi:hypothetical protein
MIKITTKSTRTYVDLGKLLKWLAPSPAPRKRRR